jgi:hypothetical protein
VGALSQRQIAEVAVRVLLSHRHQVCPTFSIACQSERWVTISMRALAVIRHSLTGCRAVKPIVSCFLLIWIAACTGAQPHRELPSAPAAHHSSPAAQRPRSLGEPGCRPPSPINSRAGLPEVQGTSDGLDMWGLLMAGDRDSRLHANEEVKIVWRITGRGDLRLTSTAPDGRTHPLEWGPSFHSGSNYTRPGDEWGAGYRFTEPGCWTLEAMRGRASAKVWLVIAA